MYVVIIIFRGSHWVYVNSCVLDLSSLLQACPYFKDNIINNRAFCSFVLYLRCLQFILNTVHRLFSNWRPCYSNSMSLNIVVATDRPIWASQYIFLFIRGQNKKSIRMSLLQWLTNVTYSISHCTVSDLLSCWILIIGSCQGYRNIYDWHKITINSSLYSKLLIAYNAYHYNW
jgi:hypothetical protein